MCTQAQLDKITNEVTQGAKKILGDKLRKVILYGSYARGDYDNESDIDIMVLADIKDEEAFPFREEMVNTTGKLCLENDIIISIFAKNYNHFYEWVEVLPFYKNVVNDGVELYVNQ